MNQADQMKKNDANSYIYKYVENNKPIYIGISNKLHNRVRQHKMEDKFQKHSKAEIFYAPMSSRQEAKAFETLLIGKYKPMLNISENNNTVLFCDINEPYWIPYRNNEQLITEKLNTPIIQKAMSPEAVVYNFLAELSMCQVAYDAEEDDIDEPDIDMFLADYGTYYRIKTMCFDMECNETVFGYSEGDIISFSNFYADESLPFDAFKWAVKSGYLVPKTGVPCCLPYKNDYLQQFYVIREDYYNLI